MGPTSGSILRQAMKLLFDRAEAVEKPKRLIFPVRGIAEVEQLPVTVCHVERHGIPQFPKADGAKMYWLGIALRQVIRSVHQAVEVNAVLETEHMSGFMSKDLAASFQYKLLRCFVVRLIGTSIETGVVSLQTVNTDSISKRRLAENKIPIVGRIEVFHGHRKKAICVFFDSWFQPSEDIGRQQLASSATTISDRCSDFFYLDGGKSLHRKVEETTCKACQLVQLRRLSLFKLANRLQVDLRLIASRTIWAAANILGIGLPGFCV